jgi:YihY family inner membrane protein
VDWVDAVDEFQQRHRFSALSVAVVRKYQDDHGRALAAVVALYGLLALFPLSLVLVTVLGYALGNDPGLKTRLLGTAFGQFPVIRDQLTTNIHPLRGHGVGVAVGVLGVAWGALGVGRALQFAMEEIWEVSPEERAPLRHRLVQRAEFLAVLGLGLVVATAAAAAGSFLHRGPAAAVAGVALSAVVDIAVFLAVFRVLSPDRLSWGQLLPGALVAAGGWVLLQTAGGYLIGHVLRHASQLYGVFGLMLGLVFVLLLGAQLIVLAAEVNQVVDTGAWPRSLRG